MGDNIICTCSICQDDMVTTNDTTIVLDPCGHSFHRICIQRWFNINESCPNCRIPVENNTDCPIIRELRSERRLNHAQIRELVVANRILSSINETLQTASLLSLPWFRDDLLDLTFAIVPTDMSQQYPQNILLNSLEHERS